MGVRKWPQNEVDLLHAPVPGAEFQAFAAGQGVIGHTTGIG
jgi:hypothetical protein